MWAATRRCRRRCHSADCSASYVGFCVHLGRTKPQKNIALPLRHQAAAGTGAELRGKSTCLACMRPGFSPRNPHWKSSSSPAPHTAVPPLKSIPEWRGKATTPEEGQDPSSVSAAAETRRRGCLTSRKRSAECGSDSSQPGPRHGGAPPCQLPPASRDC